LLVVVGLPDLQPANLRAQRNFGGLRRAFRESGEWFERIVPRPLRAEDELVFVVA
jgi:hypothetical protein